jgi:hypothetical protein
MSTEIKNGDAQPASGDFYVKNNCCLTCGFPQLLAPDLVGWADAPTARCVWKKQPVTAAELDRAISVLRQQDMGCHRYAGTDPAVLKQVDRDLCDHALPTPESNIPPL